MTPFLTKTDAEAPVIANRYTFVQYGDALVDVWEKMAEAAMSGTLLHTRKFLSYHVNKFDDQSLLVYDQGGVLRAIFPAARDPSDSTVIVSHPGITYGGLLHDGWLYGQRCLDALMQLCEYYKAGGFREIIYKAVPWIYHRVPAQDDIYALFRMGAERYRIDLSTTIDINGRLHVAERRNRSKKKAIKSGLTISDDPLYLEDYWQILAENLKSKYGKTPVHSLQELRMLNERFSTEIELVTAIADGKVMAGTLLFYCPTLIHAQYFASNAAGREANALDLVIEQAVEKAKNSGKRFFDFGISTEQEGLYLNDTLHTFKCEFGACGSVYESYWIKL